MAHDTVRGHAAKFSLSDKTVNGKPGPLLYHLLYDFNIRLYNSRTRSSGVSSTIFVNLLSPLNSKKLNKSIIFIY